MLNTRIRLFLALFFIILGVVLHFKLGINSAWYLYAAAFIMLLTHFLFNNVSAAFIKLRRGKIDEAERLLNQIKRPDFLVKRHRAYYHFTKGMVALQKEILPEAEEHLKEALKLGLRTDNDKALATLNLAHICFVQKRLQDTDTYLKKAKTYPTNDLLIKDNIAKMEKALAYPYN